MMMIQMMMMMMMMIQMMMMLMMMMMIMMIMMIMLLEAVVRSSCFMLSLYGELRDLNLNHYPL